MNIKKYISAALIGLLALTTFSSCVKEADVDGIEAKLPAIQISSMGLPVSGPFLASNTAATVQIVFGGSLTKLTTGAFKVEILSGTTVVKTVNFPAWNGKDDTSTSTTTVHTIASTAQTTTYPNTFVMSGTILLKLSALGLTTGTNYTIRLTGYSATGVSSAYTTSSVILKVS